MTEGNGRARRLSLDVEGENGWYQASCRELSIHGAGETEQEAKLSLLECARMLTLYLESLNGEAEADTRRAYVRLLREHWGNLEAAFEVRRP
jgi:hypothetical protein